MNIYKLWIIVLAILSMVFYTCENVSPTDDDTEDTPEWQTVFFDDIEINDTGTPTSLSNRIVNIEIIDTGTPIGLSSRIVKSDQWRAAEFTISDPVSLTEILTYGWAWDGGELTVAIYSDGGDKPGEVIFSATTTLPTDVPFDAHFFGVSDIALFLTPSDYWVSFLTFDTQAEFCMVYDPPFPLDNEAFSGNQGASWLNFDIQNLTVKISGDPVSETITAPLDIKPGSCPNPLNTKSKGVLPAAVLGTANLDVKDIDVASILLEGIPPLRSAIEDVSTPVANAEDECDCTTDGADGFDDLTLKFDTQAIVAALGSVSDGQQVVLTLTGNLLDGTEIEGQDCALIRKKGKKGKVAVATLPESF